MSMFAIGYLLVGTGIAIFDFMTDGYEEEMPYGDLILFWPVYIAVCLGVVIGDNKVIHDEKKSHPELEKKYNQLMNEYQIFMDAKRKLKEISAQFDSLTIKLQTIRDEEKDSVCHRLDEVMKEKTHYTEKVRILSDELTVSAKKLVDYETALDLKVPIYTEDDTVIELITREHISEG